MKKKLSYCLKLDYPIETLKIPNELGGGYTACIPQLGRNAFIGDGETREEAIEDLERTKKEIFTDYLKKGITIPEPVIDEEKPSGKYVVRMPTTLHAKLVKAAKSNKVSLNQYTIYLLSTNLSASTVIEDIKRLKESVMQEGISYGKTLTENEVATEKVPLRELSQISGTTKFIH